MHVQGDAGSHQGRMCVKGHASRVVQDVIVFHVALMVTRKLAPAMLGLRLMATGLNALNQLDTNNLFEN